MKAVILALRPRWCHAVFEKQKTIEVRKTFPKLEAPFKVYVYCTRPEKELDDYFINFDKQRSFYGGGTVIGEFICTARRPILSYPAILFGSPFIHEEYAKHTCLTKEQLIQYAAGAELYGWEISSPELYREPVPLSAFRRPCENDLICEVCGLYGEFSGECQSNALRLHHPPQSWGYCVERNTEEDC